MLNRGQKREQERPTQMRQLEYSINNASRSGRAQRGASRHVVFMTTRANSSRATGGGDLMGSKRSTIMAPSPSSDYPKRERQRSTSRTRGFWSSRRRLSLLWLKVLSLPTSTSAPAFLLFLQKARNLRTDLQLSSKRRSR